MCGSGIDQAWRSLWSICGQCAFLLAIHDIFSSRNKNYDKDAEPPPDDFEDEGQDVVITSTWPW
jgi:hypothetical protein